MKVDGDNIDSLNSGADSPNETLAILSSASTHPAWVRALLEDLAAIPVVADQDDPDLYPSPLPEAHGLRPRFCYCLGRGC